MAYPKQSEVELPLLKVLAETGGAAEPKGIYPQVAKFFPELTPEDQERRMESKPSSRKWWNLVQWARQTLVQAGQIDGSTRGVWKLTDSGRARLTLAAKQEFPALTKDVSPAARAAEAQESETTLRDLANRSRDDAKARLLSELRNLTPRAFEHFCRELLQQLGYRNVVVTAQTADGGIDGYGDFQQGAVSIKSAFQAKRWSDAPIGRPDLDRLRGALQGEFDHGVFLTTSHFSRDAVEAAYRRGAISIMLLDGEAITELMIDHGIGVIKQPLVLYEVAPEFFEFEED
jgi:restriction system protein